MNKTLNAILATVLVCSPLIMPSSAGAAPHRDDRKMTMHRGSWTRGHRLSPSDRHRAIPIDYRHHRLKAPPHGYRWVRINGSYLMIGLNSGLISAVVPVR